MPTFKVPLSFSQKGGQAFKLSEDTNDYYDQVIQAAVSIEPGELILDPAFGTQDPAFSKGDLSGLRSTIAGYWPELSLKKLEFGEIDSSGLVKLIAEYEVS